MSQLSNEYTYTIDKIQRGKMVFAINLIDRYIVLREDIPATNGEGASFSTEEISFDKINYYLSKSTVTNNIIDGVYLADMFVDQRTINNGTMLHAALKFLGCVTTDIINYLHPEMTLPSTEDES